MSREDRPKGAPPRAPSEHPTELPVDRGTATHAPVEQAGFDDHTSSAFATTRRVSTGQLRAMVRARHGSSGANAVSLPPVSPEFLERLRRIRRQGMDAEGFEFGEYTVFGLIGRGGMAQIRLAAQALEGGGVRLAVIKSLLPEHADSEPRRALLFEEGKIGAQLNHPNIVELFDAGEIDGIPYLAFELVDGLSLRDLVKLIEPARLPVSCVLDIGAQAAEALAHAHAATSLDGKPLNVVHRDVTPHNVLLTREGHVKLVDFGIARFSGRDLETQHGQLRGKLGYMAPEQCRPGPIDGRADLFALSLTLTELLAGRRVLPPTLMILQESESLIRDACADAMDAVPDGLVELLVRMAAVDPTARPWPTETVGQSFRTLASGVPGPRLTTFAAERIFNRLLPLDLPSITDEATRPVAPLGRAPVPSEGEDEDGYASTVRRLRPLSSDARIDLDPGAPEVTPPTPDPRSSGVGDFGRHVSASEAEPTPTAPDPEDIEAGPTVPSAPATAAAEPTPPEPSTPSPPELAARLIAGEGPTLLPGGPWAKDLQAGLPADFAPPDDPHLDVAPTRRVTPLERPTAAPSPTATTPEESESAPTDRSGPPLGLWLALALAAAIATFAIVSSAP